jgi:hypothetical protein
MEPVEHVIEYSKNGRVKLMRVYGGKVKVFQSKRQAKSWLHFYEDDHDVCEPKIMPYDPNKHK